MESNNNGTERYGSPRRDRRSRNVKKRALTAALICIAVCIVSGITLAYTVTHTDALKNIFSPSHVACEVLEDEFDGVTKSNVRIKNVGNTTSYIRAAVTATWISEDGKSVTAAKPESGTDYSITFNDGDSSYWEEGADGFWYYTVPVDANAETEQLIASCTEITTPPDGYCLSVEITASAIQSSPDSVVINNWSTGVTGVADGVLAIKE